MAKTKQELDALKKDLANLKSKLAELTEEELLLVTGGARPRIDEEDIQILKTDPHEHNIML